MAVINVYGLTSWVQLARQEMEEADIKYLSGVKSLNQARRQLHLWRTLNVFCNRLKYAIVSVQRLQVCRADLSVHFREEWGTPDFRTQVVTIVVEGLYIPGPDGDKIRQHLANKLIKEGLKLKPQVDCVVHSVESKKGYATSRDSAI